MMTVNKMESMVFDQLLYGDCEILSVLREQRKTMTVSSREFTGAGQYTYLYVPDPVVLVGGEKSFVLEDVVGYSDDTKHGFGFVLYVEAGKLLLLEGYTYDEPYPEEAENFRCEYKTGVDRDWKKLCQYLAQL
jgi:hypothetical protein